LGSDALVIKVFPLPGVLQEFFSGHSIAFFAFFGEGFLYQHLGGDTRVVSARNPQCRDAFHPVVADHQVFHRDKHGVTGVELTGNIGRGD